MGDILAARNDNKAFLRMPAQNYLCRRFAVFLAEPFEYRLFNKRFIAVSKASVEADERDKDLQERESKLIISERKFNAKQALAESNLPAELVDFLDYSSDDSYKESLEKLSDIIINYRNKNPIHHYASTGLTHGTATSDSYDEFTRILKE